MRQVWGADAAVFKPERWENDGSPPHPFAYLPFAAGSRGCIGKEFSLLEQKIGLVRNRIRSGDLCKAVALFPPIGAVRISACSLHQHL
jgi:hypothetical protein